MAKKTNNLTVKFLADTKHLEKGMISLNKKIKSFGKMSTGSGAGKASSSDKGVFGQVNKGFKMLKSSSRDLLGGLENLTGGTLSYAAAAGVAYMGLKKVISAGMEAEDAIVKLGVMFKSESKGLDVYQKALEKSVVTPFDPRDIVAAAVQAQGYIGKAGDTFTKGLYGIKGDAMTLIADMASFSGQTATEAATALFRADLALLDKYGADARRVYKKAKSVAQIGSQKFVSTFVKGMSEIATWQGMAAKRSQTISGLVSTIRGNIGLIFTYLSGATEQKGVETFWSHLRSIMLDISNGLGKFVKAIKPALTMVGAELGRKLAYVWETIKMIWNFVAPLIETAWSLISPIMTIMTEIGRYMFKIFQLVIKLIVGMTNIFRKWMDSIFGATKKISTIVKWLQKLILWIKMAFMFVISGLDGWITKFLNWLDSIPEKIKELFKVIEEFVSSFFKEIGEETDMVGEKIKDFFGIGGDKKFSMSREETIKSVLPNEMYSKENTTSTNHAYTTNKNRTVNNNSIFNITNMFPGEKNAFMNQTGAPAYGN